MPTQYTIPWVGIIHWFTVAGEILVIVAVMILLLINVYYGVRRNSKYYNKRE
ncbi:MAG TPA: hypothetical protein VFX17_03315 [Patescibacteria group bacterium]|nr:hypothetical protein [Patescibacteria group bacterium]